MVFSAGDVALRYSKVDNWYTVVRVVAVHDDSYTIESADAAIWMKLRELYDCLTSVRVNARKRHSRFIVIICLTFLC